MIPIKDYTKKPRVRASLTVAALLSSILFTGCVPTQGHYQARQLNPAKQNYQTQTYYAGYSKKFLPYREKLEAGQVQEVQKAMMAEEKSKAESTDSDIELANKLRLVGLMERSSLALQTGDADQSLRYCTLAQEIIEERETESYSKEFFSNVGGALVGVMGAGEMGRYDAPGYEKVLLLNLTSMAYLLNGDERAFNVARLAIDWQQEEKEKFEQELTKEKEKVEKDTQQKKQKKKQVSNGHTHGLVKALDTEFSKYDKKALQVSNAFVNPFGDYVTGMVNEFKSVKLKSLISNAHIAYKQALELNPNSKVLKKAVADTKKRKSASHLIHVVAMDGFVPEKKVLSIPAAYDVDVEIPTYEPIPSSVAKIKITNMNGKALSTLHTVADIEALALRHQKDRLPGVYAMVVASLARDISIIEAGNNLMGGLGNFAKNMVDSSLEPDTTCWMSLPSRILASRFYAPPGLKRFKVATYDKKGRKLSEKVVKLNGGENHFVLVRSIEKTLYAFPSKKIWSPKKRTQMASK